MIKANEKRLLAPVLDRLLDSTNTSALSQPHQILRQLRESVRRDLEFLFNTRIRCLSPPSESQHLENSILNYGLPDLATINLNSVDNRKEFCRTIERCILANDPRIKSVKVKSDEKIDNEDPSIRFRVEAVLHTNPAPELIVFDSALNPINQTVDVQEIV
jgi:type VI secretion system protein ImpF